MLHRNKRGVSEIVSYVILIVMVMAISSLVFYWTKSLVPKDNIECPEVSLIINDYECDNNVFRLVVSNKGLFDVSGYYIWAENETEGRKILLKEINGLKEGKVEFTNKLSSGQEYESSFDYSAYGSIKNVEIEPFVFDEEEILCNKAIIKQNIDC